MNSFLCRFLVASSALLACGSFSVAGPITDKALESAIRAVLHEPTAELTDEKLLKLFILELFIRKFGGGFVQNGADG